MPSGGCSPFSRTSRYRKGDNSDAGFREWDRSTPTGSLMGRSARSARAASVQLFSVALQAPGALRNSSPTLRSVSPGMRSASNPRTTRPSHCAARPKPAQRVRGTAQRVPLTAQRVQSSHSASKLRTERPNPARRIQRPHRASKVRTNQVQWHAHKVFQRSSFSLRGETCGVTHRCGTMWNDEIRVRTD